VIPVVPLLLDAPLLEEIASVVIFLDAVGCIGYINILVGVNMDFVRLVKGVIKSVSVFPHNSILDLGKADSSRKRGIEGVFYDPVVSRVRDKYAIGCGGTDNREAFRRTELVGAGSKRAGDRGDGTGRDIYGLYAVVFRVSDNRYASLLSTATPCGSLNWPSRAP
jgi:hypothetical protein